MMVHVDPEKLRATIAAHPWSAFALSVAAGAWLALKEPRGRIARTASSALAAMALAALRQGTTRLAAEQARSWIDARSRRSAAS